MKALAKAINLPIFVFRNDEEDVVDTFSKNRTEQKSNYFKVRTKNYAQADSNEPFIGFVRWIQ